MANRDMIKACLVLTGITFFLATDRVECGPIGRARRRLDGEAIFDVMKFGAKADGQTDDALSFIQAWNGACKSPGPATVLIPNGNYMAGEVIFAGPCTPQQTVTVQIQGNVSANPDPSSYTNGAWIVFQRVDNVVVTGGGTINGQGSQFWQYAGGDVPLAVSLVFQTVGFGKLNNLKFVDSMGFHTKVTDSHDVEVTNLTITAPGTSPNTDGMHLSNATNVNITDSLIGTGDDCVSVGHGSKNVMVARITCGPGHGMSIGSLGKRPDETSVEGITIANCTLVGTTNGARIKTYHGSPVMEAKNIIFKDIIMREVKNPIIIDQHYNSKRIPEPSKVKITDTHFINIKGSTISPIPISLNCSATNPCEGIELADIDFTPFGSIGPLKSACENAKTVANGSINPQAPTC